MPGPQISLMSCGGFESKQRSQTEGYRQPLCWKHTPMAGVGFRDGRRNVDWERGGLWKHTLLLMAFTDCGLKAKCSILCPPLHSIIPSSSSLSCALFPPFSVPLQLPHKTHILRSFLTAGFSIQYTHAATHSHSDIAHPRGTGTGPKCLMLWFQGDSVTAAEGRNRCASLRFN